MTGDFIASHDTVYSFVLEGGQNELSDLFERFDQIKKLNISSPEKLVNGVVEVASTDKKLINRLYGNILDTVYPGNGYNITVHPMETWTPSYVRIKTHDMETIKRIMEFVMETSKSTIIHGAIRDDKGKFVIVLICIREAEADVILSNLGLLLHDIDFSFERVYDTSLIQENDDIEFTMRRASHSGGIRVPFGGDVDYLCHTMFIGGHRELRRRKLIEGMVDVASNPSSVLIVITDSPQEWSLLKPNQIFSSNDADKAGKWILGQMKQRNDKSPKDDFEHHFNPIVLVFEEYRSTPEMTRILREGRGEDIFLVCGVSSDAYGKTNSIDRVCINRFIDIDKSVSYES